MKRDITVGIALRKTTKITINLGIIITIDNNTTTIIIETITIRANIIIIKKIHGKIGITIVKPMEEDSDKHIKDLNASIVE
jgi:hypothetical protein